MTLPSGNWDIDGNGFRGTLTINGVDDAGNLNASVVSPQEFLYQHPQALHNRPLSRAASPTGLDLE
jgi:hypothetical protein